MLLLPSHFQAAIAALLIPTAVGFLSPSPVNAAAALNLFASSSSFSDEFLATFSGDFDNYNQVVRDRQDGMLPREGGGHEHIHCTLVPLSPKVRLAAFYFDGNPRKIFRFRCYEIHDDGNMKLYTLAPDIESAMREETDPMKWPLIFLDHHDEARIQELPRCDVQWNQNPDPVQHEYALKAYPGRSGNHAVMVYGEAIVDSTMMPGSKILIRDQLSLWDDEFWIHDRGFKPDDMSYIYGNQKGVPYQLERVTSIEDGERIISNKELQWTLGECWRTDEEYRSKMAVISGVSSKLNSA